MGPSFSTTLKMHIHVPLSQEIKYRPGVMETLKFAWVQYVMCLIPSLYVCFNLLSYLFKY